MTDSALPSVIDAAFERRTEFSPKSAPAEIRDAVEQAITLLDSGKARVAEKHNGQWQVNQWLKKAVLLSFRLNDNQPIDAGFTRFFDKVALKYSELRRSALPQRRRSRRAARDRPPRRVRCRPTRYSCLRTSTSARTSAKER